MQYGKTQQCPVARLGVLKHCNPCDPCLLPLTTVLGLKIAWGAHVRRLPGNWDIAVFSLGTPVLSTITKWQVVIKPQYGRKVTINKIPNSKYELPRPHLPLMIYSGPLRCCQSEVALKRQRVIYSLRYLITVSHSNRCEHSQLIMYIT